MIDFHTHLLPSVDDGAKSVKESISLLRQLGEQGVTVAYATPHFYAESDSPARFFERRAEAAKTLRLATQGLSLPAVRLGAEVAYFSGISDAEVTSDMRLEESDLLLLEMPLSEWTDYMIGELIALAHRPAMRVLLAHVERYLPFVGKKTLLHLRENGFLMQVNVHAILDPWKARNVAWLIREGIAQIIASDCHGVHRRPPMLEQACKRLDRRLGDGTADRITRFGYTLITSGAKPQKEERL